MWEELRHPRHREFYEQMHRDQQGVRQDWMPMVRAMERVQAMPEASGLFAFTSLWRFHITTAPSYAGCERHSSISIIWHPYERRFRLAFGRLAEGWVDDRPPEAVCDEDSLLSSLDPFIKRLLDSDPEKEGEPGATDNPDDAQ